MKDVDQNSSENSISGGGGIADQVSKVSVNLETQIMRYFPESKAYQNKARSLIFNLKDKGNVWLKQSLLDGSLEPKRAV